MAEPQTSDTAERERVFVGTGLFWGFIGLLLFAVAVVVLAAQNPQPVEFQWLRWEIRTPLVVIILATALVAIVLAELTGLAWRRRRRRILGERAELRQLRSQSGARDSQQPLTEGPEHTQPRPPEA
ncbi:MAG: LapA family protein [Actinomycetota bacterium]|nr:LapA family protein [Actinomycetota bacterium]